LQPGESYQHTFDRAGEYFFNDCTDPRPTGKIEVYLDPQDQPGALRFIPSRLNLEPKKGIFSPVTSKVFAYFQLPRGYRYDSGAVLIAPLSQNPVEPTKVTSLKNHVVLVFDEADIDHNVPEGETSLTVRLNVLQDGVQKQLTSTAAVRVVK
uniref:cupredoxin domain-containing protein n=1 Tax=Conyzicola sp. TaxID=1969404 RepID=UPI003989C196